MTALLKKFLGIGSLLALTGLMSAPLYAQQCNPAHKFETITPGVLTVTSWVFPPYSAPLVNGQVGGIDGEVLMLIAARECLKIVASSLDPSAAIQSVVSGKADLVIGDWYRTAERAKVLGLADPIYLDQMAILSKEGLTTISSLQGKRVGTVQGYLWVADLQKLLGNSLVLYSNPVAMAQDLAAGRVDIGVDSFSVGIIAQKKGGYPGIKIRIVEPDQRVRASVEPGQATFPYTRSNTALGEALNADIAELHKAGEIARILKEHGLDPSAANVGTPRLVQ